MPLKDNSRNTFRTTVRDCLVIQYGMQWLEANRLPYFSITAENKKNRSFGCLHDDIARLAPDLAPLIKWHLVDQDGTPLNYFANAIYWHKEMCKKLSFGSEFENFKSIIVFGAVPEYDCIDVAKQWGDDVKVWLEKRLPLLQLAFVKEMENFGIEFIKTEA